MSILLTLLVVRSFLLLYFAATTWPLAAIATHPCLLHKGTVCTRPSIFTLLAVLCISVLTRTKRFSFFMPTLPCLVAFCQAFPPLYDDVAALLVQVGQVCASDVATKTRDIDPLIAREYMRCITPSCHIHTLLIWKSVKIHVQMTERAGEDMHIIAL